MIINLQRFAYLPKGTLGRGELNGYTFYTVELPWKDNAPNVSCIPEGLYKLRWDTTGRIREVPELVAVPNRTHINIHVANEPEELHGCIAPGDSFSIQDSYPRVHQSRFAMDSILDQLGRGFADDAHEIHITAESH